MVWTRALLVLLVLVALAAAGAGSVSAAEPTLGATIESRLYADEDRELAVINRSNVPAVFTFAPSGGWQLDTSAMTLAPDESASVTVTQVGRVDGAPMEVRIGAEATPAPGQQRAEIALTATLWTERPADYALLIAIAALVTVGVTVVAASRLRRNGIRS